jgi:hypothetical protein
MRHRASRPQFDLWHRLPRATARLLGEAASLGPVRALLALTVVLSLGTGAVVAVSSVTGGNSNRRAESADLALHLGEAPTGDGEAPTGDGEAPTGDGEWPNATEVPMSDDRTPKGSRAEPGPVKGSPSSGTPTRSATSSRPRATVSTTPEDITPPNTSLSAEFPAGDAARFTFSANEAASFTCSLDGAAYTPCSSAASYSDLDPGWHTFAVRAVDAAGNVDPSPAETRWHARDGRAPDQ